jgi:flagellar hook-associated protein 3 FlgL
VVQVHVTGDEVFGFNAGQNVFTLLDTIVTQVTSADSAGMSASIEAIDAALDRMLVGRGKLGTVANQIEQAQLRNQADEIGLRTVLSETEDTDLAAAIIELQMQETAYQAAQGALARALQPSLAQFLR